VAGRLLPALLGIPERPPAFPASPRCHPHGYIFTWLGLVGVGGLLGTVAGILIADYWILRRGRLDLADLYRGGGRCWYDGGWNWRAVAAFVTGGVLAVGGAGFHPLIDGRPVPALSSLADYGWAVGLGTSAVLYVALMLLTGRNTRVRVRSDRTARA
jgi:nucleobase:cation symporter-1, NCS1 family